MHTNDNRARKEFLNKIIDFNEYMHTDAPAMTKEERKRVVQEWSDSIQKNKIRKRENKRKRRLKKARLARRKFVGRIAAFALAGIAVVSGENAIHNEYKSYQEQNSPITLEQALELGETTQTLGINENTILEIQEIEKILEKGNLTNKEIIELAPKINSVYFSAVKGKLSNVLNVEEGNVKLYTEPTREGTTMESVKVRRGESTDVYLKKDFLRNDNSISTEISDSIKNISEMQKIMDEIQQGDFNRDAIIEKYKNIVNGVSQIAAAKFNIDEKGNISVEQTKVKDLNKQPNEIKTASIDEGHEL